MAANRPSESRSCSAAASSMGHCATVFGASTPDRLPRLVQKRVFGDRVKIPLEIRLWYGYGRTNRLGAASSRR